MRSGDFFDFFLSYFMIVSISFFLQPTLPYDGVCNPSPKGPQGFHVFYLGFFHFVFFIEIGSERDLSEGKSLFYLVFSH